MFEVNYRLDHISDVHVIGVVNTSKGAFTPEFTPESLLTAFGVPRVIEKPGNIREINTNVKSNGKCL